MKRILLVLVVSAIALASPLQIAGQGITTHTHIVQWGQTLYAISRLYNVPMSSIREANKLTDVSIVTGQKLLIPLLTPLQVHTVSRGETLLSISRKYGVRVVDIAWANNIVNTNLIITGQKLVIPPSPTVSGTITPRATATAPVVQEAIIITNPILNSKITSPLTVTGWGSGFENTLSVAVLDEDGHIIGEGYVTVDAEFGQYGPFTGVIRFTMPSKAQVGKIQVFSVSPRDGSLDHLNSVMVKFQP